jgi:hypothetical protein
VYGTDYCMVRLRTVLLQYLVGHGSVASRTSSGIAVYWLFAVKVMLTAYGYTIHTCLARAFVVHVRGTILDARYYTQLSRNTGETRYVRHTTNYSKSVSVGNRGSGASQPQFPTFSKKPAKFSSRRYAAQREFRSVSNHSQFLCSIPSAEFPKAGF